MNKKQILFNFIKEYKNSNSDKRDEAIEKAEKEISTLLKAERQSIIKKIRKTLKEYNIAPSDMKDKLILEREQFINRIKSLK